MTLGQRDEGQFISLQPVLTLGASYLLLKSVFYGGLNPIRSRKLITKKMLRANRRNPAVELRDSPNPSTIGQLSGHAPDELCVRPAHVRREMKNRAIFDHDQHSIPITHLEFLAHGIGSRLTKASGLVFSLWQNTITLITVRLVGRVAPRAPSLPDPSGARGATHPTLSMNAPRPLRVAIFCFIKADIAPDKKVFPKKTGPGFSRRRLTRRDFFARGVVPVRRGSAAPAARIFRKTRRGSCSTRKTARAAR